MVEDIDIDAVGFDGIFVFGELQLPPPSNLHRFIERSLFLGLLLLLLLEGAMLSELGTPNLSQQ